MNFSKTERTILCFTLLLLTFLAGWFLSQRHQASLAFVPAPSPSVSAGQPILPDSAPSASAPARININTADSQLLQTLPGIGEKRAADIIAYRESHGPFPIPEAITDVPGIGAGTLEEILDLITVEDPSHPTTGG